MLCWLKVETRIGEVELRPANLLDSWLRPMIETDSFVYNQSEFEYKI